MLENYTVIDLEMTGLDPKRDRILEIGAIKIRQKQAVESFSCLLRWDLSLSDKVQELTGITQDMMAEGEEPEAAISSFLDFIGEDIWIGHNILFDYSFVKQWAVNHKIPFQKKAADTLKIARKCLPELEKKTLDYLCGYYGIFREKSHRAKEDALATWKLYEILENQFISKAPEMFLPRELQYKAKRQTPATQRQKIYLNELIKYHKIELDISFAQLSRSDASRLTDKIIHQYGRLPVSAGQASEKNLP